MFQCLASVANSGPVLKRYCVFVADSDTTLSQQRDKSVCGLGTLNTIPFDSQLYIYLKVQKLSGDF